MNKKQPSILVSPAFVITLCLLLLNDFYLKPSFHNWLTGKLSDFAGLFVFPLFWLAFFPRYKKTVYLLTAILFFFWKSIYSQPLIDAWNGLSIISIGRVVDPTDLSALLVLPLSYLYFEHGKQNFSPRIAVHFMAVLSAFAFIATSPGTSIEFNNNYEFKESKIELLRKVYHLEDLNPDYKVGCESSYNAGAVRIGIPSNFCSLIGASIIIDEVNGQAVIKLKSMQHSCPEGSNDKQRLLATFENDFIDKLKQISLDLPASQSGDANKSPKRARLNVTGQLYFIAIGDLPDIRIIDLANYFNEKYKLHIKVLPEIPVTNEVREQGNPYTRPIADRVIETIKRRNTEIANNPESVIVAVINNMYVPQSNRIYTFSHQADGRFAVVAIEGINPATFCEPENKDLLGSRLQKLIARNIAAVYYRLPQSNDPKSVLYSSVGCVHELDRIGEDY